MDASDLITIAARLALVLVTLAAVFSVLLVVVCRRLRREMRPDETVEQYLDRWLDDVHRRLDERNERLRRERRGGRR